MFSERIGRKRKDAFEFIKKRIMNKIDSWDNRFLSQAEKEVLPCLFYATKRAYLTKPLVTRVTFGGHYLKIGIKSVANLR